MWILYALVVHILLLGSIFVIYFRSPVITGLQPQTSLTDIGLVPPAKRLVLIVTDGLRAESFFEKNCSHVPHLRSLFLNGGLVGISRTRVPTESRPGHIALIAGLYEDPSAVTRGWKENPIEFDTLFNRSAQTYAWGANDVLHIFARLADGGRPMHFDAYDHDLDFSGRDKTFALDDWVFKRVRLLLQRKKDELREAKQVVFFLHLLGLDTAGHVHKPGTTDFLENLHQTERGILDIYQDFERTFPDERTAYVLTSDHGMTNAGSHGAGDPHETDTPFYLWGAGIANEAPNNGKTFAANEHTHLPLHELEQAQLAPLMSALIGLPPPMNNFGILPNGYLNVSAEYEAHAAHSNTLQLLAQFQRLQAEHQRGVLARFLNSFERLNEQQIAIYLSTIEKMYKLKQFKEALDISLVKMSLILEGIDYYHGYYRNVLLLSTTATFTGWIFYLQQLLLLRNDLKFRKVTFNRNRIVSFGLIGLSIMIFAMMQRIPFAIAFYLILPIFVWLLAMQQRTTNAIKQYLILPYGQLVLLIACAELLVFSFYERKLISLGFVFFTFASNYRAFTTKDLKFYLWFFLIVALAIFPILPVSVGYKNTTLLLFGILLTIIRPIFAKTRLNWHSKVCNIAGLLNGLFCIYQHTNQVGNSLIFYTISWCFLIYTFVSIILNPTLILKQRVELIFFNLSSLYALLCTSYESLFMLMLGTALTLALSAQQTHQPVPLDGGAGSRNNSVQQLQMSFRLAFDILLYTFFSFFGTGNIASVSSFDPNIIRCFLTTFSPFIIMALVILKLIIPVVLNISIIFGLSEFARTNERRIFICLLLICDIMGLNFLFLVRNTGSWLEIGSSISHFVIMEVTTLVLLLLTYLSKILLKMSISVRPFKLK